MNVSEDPPERDREDTEECVHRDHEEDMKGTSVAKSSQERVRSRTVNLMREDLNQVKEEFFKVLKDRDTKADRHNSVSALSLLRDDLTQFREDVSSIFSFRDAKSNDAAAAAEKTLNPLSVLKEDISSVLRNSLFKDKDAGGLNGTDGIPNVQVKEAGGANNAITKLFRRQQRRLRTAEDGLQTPPEKSEDHTDQGPTQELPDDGENVENVIRDTADGVEDGIETKETPETTSGQGEQTACPSKTDTGLDNDNCVTEENETNIENGEESETLEWENRLPELKLFSQREHVRDGDVRKRPEGGGGAQGREDPWSVKNFACYLTFDPNTANSELLLSNCNRTATRVWSENRCIDHLDRFRHCPQLLCREGLLDSVYWEVEWSGGADVGITYNNICRDGDVDHCLLGHNSVSWSLECSEGIYTPCHNNRRFKSSSPQPFSHRVGLYLDWYGGTLSFYCVAHEAMIHLHTFTTTFTQPLYPGFWVWPYDGSVSLCQVELDWERLLK